MISPYGSSKLGPLYVADSEKRRQLLDAAQDYDKLLLSSAAAANAVMLGTGYFTPLTGYMNIADSLSVAREMQTRDGLMWPIPIINLRHEVPAGDKLALTDPNIPGHPVLAIQQVQDVEKISSLQLQEITQQVFGTTDPMHPGVNAFASQGEYLVSGPIQLLNYSYFERDFPDTFRTAAQIRTAIDQRGWQRVVAFQTRNPMHRAHEELCRMARQQVNADGILIHMLLGKLKPGDIPAEVRDAAIRKMVELYFPANTVMIAGYGFDMLYAGPREAVLHAIFRQNAGCTHLIVGRDHAGMGNYYGAFDAQEIFDDQVPAGNLEIEIFRADHTAWSKKLNKVVMMRDAPDHSPEDFLLLSGTRVREILAAGEELPAEFARPEVARILMDYYQKR